MTLPYKIVYLKYESRKIYNYVGPWDWRDNQDRISKRSYIYERKQGWYEELEEDILANGFKNPILAVSRVCTKNDFSALPEFAKSNYLICNFLGGSRLFVAQKHNLNIPVIVSDFSNSYIDKGLNLYNAKEIIKLFAESPTSIIYSKYGLKIESSK